MEFFHLLVLMIGFIDLFLPVITIVMSLVDLLLAGIGTLQPLYYKKKKIEF